MPNWISNRLAYKSFDSTPWTWGLYTLMNYSTCMFGFRKGYEKVVWNVIWPPNHECVFGSHFSAGYQTTLYWQKLWLQRQSTTGLTRQRINWYEHITKKSTDVRQWVHNHFQDSNLFVKFRCPIRCESYPILLNWYTMPHITTI